MKKSILELQNISKRFGGTQALSNVSLTVETQNILALLGENGAGKSTLIKILAGVYEKDSGIIKYQGNVIENTKALVSEANHPVAFIHQDLGLINWMTVAENIGFATGFPQKHKLFINWKEMYKRAQDALNILGVNIDPKERIMNLSRAEQSLVAISRAIAEKSSVIFLDEPTASLPAPDVQKVFEVLKKLKKQGVAIVLVSHRLDEIFAVCDDVFVLRDGKMVGNCKVESINEKELVRLIVGKDTQTLNVLPIKTDKQIIINVKSVEAGSVGPVSFDVNKGEILALSGLRGAGQESVSRVLFGAEQITDGEILLNGKPFVATSPEKAIKNSIGLLAKDRINESLCTTMTVAENMFINPTNHGYSFLYSLKNEVKRSCEEVNNYDIRPKDTRLEINALSGGNQQKVILARWLDMHTSVLLLEDPTQGVDIGARIEIYKYIMQAVQDRNCAIIIVSTDFQEIAAIASRALVFSKGAIVKELIADEVSVNNLLYYASAYEKELA